MSVIKRILAATMILALLAGCAVVPARGSYYQPYGTVVVRPAPYYAPHHFYGFRGGHHWH